jgi:DNA-3-methyladenine glycosylase II
MRKAVNHLKNADAVLAAILDRVGAYGIEYRDPDFDTLVRSIVYQQLSGRVARVIFDRLCAAATTNGERLRPESILRLRPARMRKLGVSPQKTEYIRDLAKRTIKGQVNFDILGSLSDEKVVEQLTQVKGIGVWTAHMFLIFALRRPNVLPVGDLGIRMAMKRAYQLEDLPKPAEMQKLAESWHPYCSVASWYLWRSLENQGAL